MTPLDSIIMPIIHFVEGTVTAWGAWGIMFLMAIESANIPLPSEAILTFAGYLVAKGALSVHAAAFAGAIGCVLGSIPSYCIGYFGGRPFVEKYGKWFLVSKHDLAIADRWEAKYGDVAFFICRMLPLVRTFISLPAGILKANFPRFITFTFIGSLIWSYVLVFVGIKLGENRNELAVLWHKFDIAIVSIVLLMVVIYIKRHIRHLRK
jgi:membrane protein DedA with SNARE-associated domain